MVICPKNLDSLLSTIKMHMHNLGFAHVVEYKWNIIIQL